jgi:hypothetical protein
MVELSGGKPDQAFRSYPVHVERRCDDEKGRIGVRESECGLACQELWVQRNLNGRPKGPDAREATQSGFHMLVLGGMSTQALGPWANQQPSSRGKGILSRQSRPDGDKRWELQGGVVTAAVLLAPKARRILWKNPPDLPLLLIRLEPEMQDPPC